MHPLDEIVPAEPDESRPPSWRRAVVVVSAAVVVAVLLGLVAVIELRTTAKTGPTAADPPKAEPVLPFEGATRVDPTPDAGPPATEAAGTSTPARTPPGNTLPPKPSAITDPIPPPASRPVTCCELPGTGTALIGTVDSTTARPGTYRTDGPTGGSTCSWWLATDPDGTDRVAGSSVEHRTEVTVKPGLWFHSEKCHGWHSVTPGSATLHRQAIRLVRPIWRRG